MNWQTKEKNSLFEVYVTYHKMHQFLVYNSMIFGNFTQYRSHFHKSVLEHLHLPNNIPYTHLQYSPLLPWAPGNH